ncbi:MAG: hypothetical protein JO316_23145 [Abitibacteriaceae bacterium]|nr:hypothetical protein [Abditibacteriaceae bacterium]MBV9868262.1 hypothetical protein [Abditibacteriaceae bacterium]
MKHKELFEAWRECSVNDAPYVLQGDDFLLKNTQYQRWVSIHHSYNEFVASKDFGLASDKRLHLGLLPAPYRGNLNNSSVFLLLLNPGVKPCDYFAEYNEKDYRDAVIRNLRQDNEEDEYPFFSLNPAFAWHPSGLYWRRKFASIIQKIEANGLTYHQALRHVAQNISCLQYVPYHSERFGLPSKVHKQLTSPKLIIDYVKNTLAPRARRGEAMIVVMRQVQNWNLQEHENIILYKDHETRAAHLTSDSKERIVNHLMRLL